jgi:hypothetical protein
MVRARTKTMVVTTHVADSELVIALHLVNQVLKIPVLDSLWTLNKLR